MKQAVKKSNNQKAELLSKEVQHIDITSFDARPIVDAMKKMSFIKRNKPNSERL